jgi:hypothetical protein
VVRLGQSWAKYGPLRWLTCRSATHSWRKFADSFKRRYDADDDPSRPFTCHAICDVPRLYSTPISTTRHDLRSGIWVYLSLGGSGSHTYYLAAQDPTLHLLHNTCRRHGVDRSTSDSPCISGWKPHTLRNYIARYHLMCMPRTLVKFLHGPPLPAAPSLLHVHEHPRDKRSVTNAGSPMSRCFADVIGHTTTTLAFSSASSSISYIRLAHYIRAG